MGKITSFADLDDMMEGPSDDVIFGDEVIAPATVAAPGAVTITMPDGDVMMSSAPMPDVDEAIAAYAISIAEIESAEAVMKAVKDKALTRLARMANAFPHVAGSITVCTDKYEVVVETAERNSWDSDKLAEVEGASAPGGPVTSKHSISNAVWKRMNADEQAPYRDALTTKLSDPKIKSIHRL